MATHNCNKCGKEFTPRKGLRNYCSMKCRNARTLSDADKKRRSAAVKKTLQSKQGIDTPTYKSFSTVADTNHADPFIQRKGCEKCGERFFPKKGLKRFCSMQCRNSRDWTDEVNEKRSQTLSKSKPLKMYKHTCEYKGCQKTFETRRKNQKYCNYSCAISQRMSSKAERKKMSAVAKRTGLGGCRNVCSWGWYTSPFAGKVYLESSYEYEIARQLDEQGIEWTRPKPLKYQDEKGDTRRYFPDFYLVKANVYLDPKNDYLIPKDSDKIQDVATKHQVSVLIIRKPELPLDNIESIISDLQGFKLKTATGKAKLLTRLHRGFSDISQILNNWHRTDTLKVKVLKKAA